MTLYHWIVMHLLLLMTATTNVDAVDDPIVHQKRFDPMTSYNPQQIMTVRYDIRKHRKRNLNMITPNGTYNGDNLFVRDDNNNVETITDDADDTITDSRLGKGNTYYDDDDTFINGKGKDSGPKKSKKGKGSDIKGKGSDGKGKGSDGKGKGSSSKGGSKGKGNSSKGKGDIPQRPIAPTWAPRTNPPTFSPTVRPTRYPRRSPVVSLPTGNGATNFTAVGDDMSTCQSNDGNIGIMQNNDNTTTTVPMITSYQYELKTGSAVTSQLVQDWILPDVEISFNNVLGPFVLSQCSNNIMTTTTTKSSDIYFLHRRRTQQWQSSTLLPTVIGIGTLPIDTLDTTKLCQNLASSSSCYVIVGQVTLYAINNTDNEGRRDMQINDNNMITLQYYTRLVNNVLEQWILNTTNFASINPLIQSMSYVSEEEANQHDDDIAMTKDINLEPFHPTDHKTKNTNIVVGVFCGIIGGLAIFATVNCIQRQRSAKSIEIAEEAIHIIDNTTEPISMKQIIYPKPHHRILEEDLYYDSDDPQMPTTDIWKNNGKHNNTNHNKQKTTSLRNQTMKKHCELLI